MSGRERSLQAILAAFAGLEFGRTLGLGRVATLADLRATVPLMDLTTHAHRVESHLGFGAIDPRDPRAAELTGLSWERPEVGAVWRSFLAGGLGERPRALVLQARDFDPNVDRLLEGDLAAIGAEVLRIDQVAGPEAALERLKAAAPAILAVPSAYTITWLERQVRGPLDRALPSLRLCVASHDLGHRVRARVRVESAGWIHRSGRLGLPSPRPPARAFTLAVGSQVIELLPHREVDDEGRRVFEDRTILPEHAIVGQRYELVVSSPLGCLRLRTDEHVHVVGFDPPTALAPFPRPRVIRLRPPPQPVVLEGVTLAGAGLAAALRVAFRPEEPALVAATVGPDPASLTRSAAESANLRADPFADTEFGGAGRSGVRTLPLHARALLVQVEVQGLGRGDLAGRLARAIDDDLRRRSPAYDHLRSRSDLWRPRVAIVAPGTFEAARDRRIAALRGRVGVPEVRIVGLGRSSIFPSITHGVRLAGDPP